MNEEGADSVPERTNVTTSEGKEARQTETRSEERKRGASQRKRIIEERIVLRERLKTGRENDC
jgi:hypothetical protein